MIDDIWRQEIDDIWQALNAIKEMMKRQNEVIDRIIKILEKANEKAT